MEVRFKDNSDKVKEAFEEQILKALDGIGATVTVRAQDKAPVDTGALLADIRYEVEPGEKAVYIGNTPEIPYAKYQELGTSKMPAHPYLKPACMDAKGDIQRLVKGTLKDDGSASFVMEIITAAKQGYKQGKNAGKKFEKKLNNSLK